MPEHSFYELGRAFTSIAKREWERASFNDSLKKEGSAILSEVHTTVTNDIERNSRRDPRFSGRPKYWRVVKQDLSGFCERCRDVFGKLIRYECADQDYLDKPAEKVGFDCLDELRKRKRCKLCELVLRRIPQSATCSCNTYGICET